ncbi:MAG: DUF1328 domain-containing protein [Roseiarcus sp.]
MPGNLIYYALVLIVIALVAAFLGFGGVAGTAMGGAHLLIWLAVVIVIVGVVFPSFAELKLGAQREPNRGRPGRGVGGPSGSLAAQPGLDRALGGTGPRKATTFSFGRRRAIGRPGRTPVPPTDHGAG